MSKQKTVQRIHENVGKKNYEMRNFFEKLIAAGELEAYLAKVDAEAIEKDTGEEKVVRTKKGLSLTKIKTLDESVRGSPVLLKNTKTNTRYYLELESHGGEFYDDGNSQTTYDNCTLKRLASNFDPLKVTKKTTYGWLGPYEIGISFPEGAVDGKVHVSCEKDWKGDDYSGDHIAATRGSLTVEGRLDDLFTKVCEFVRGK